MSKTLKRDGSEKGVSLRSFSTTLSVLALIVSATSARVSYVAAFAPADVSVSCSDPIWFTQQLDVKPVGKTAARKSALLLKMSCAFANNGSATGAIQNLAFRLESLDGTKWLYSPQFLADDAKWSSEGRNSYSWVLGGFVPVLVPGKQTVFRSYVFYPEDDLPQFQNVTLTPHEFIASVQLWRLGEDHWTRHDRKTINLDSDAIEQINSGAAFVMPSSEQQSRYQTMH